MPDGYDTHADYMNWVRDDALARHQEICDALRLAFSQFIELRAVEVINFSSMTVMDLAGVVGECPSILKPIMACCNVAGRAIERDLEIRNLNTYQPRLSSERAAAIAGYLKPFLPQELAIPALGELDRHFFVDKQIRMLKGQWEKRILAALNRQATCEFRKRKFETEGELFELDAASPTEGTIEVGIDVKRIEARRDIHKRCDEIVNKASKFQEAFPYSRFVAVVYYPFTAEHINVQHRLDTPQVDAIVFASQSQQQLSTAVGLMLDKLGLRRKSRKK